MKKWVSINDKVQWMNASRDSTANEKINILELGDYYYPTKQMRRTDVIYKAKQQIKMGKLMKSKKRKSKANILEYDEYP